MGDHAMRVASWNVNSITKRLDLVLDWLDRTQPDVVALQELKTPTESFPTEAFAQAGYSSIAVGQRTWNGVALLARAHDPLPLAGALPGDPKDREARYVEAAVNGVLFCSLYLPNGNPQPGPKLDYKLAWFQRLHARAAQLWATGQPVVLMGDWNVVPTDTDIYNPANLAGRCAAASSSAPGVCGRSGAGLDGRTQGGPPAHDTIHFLGLPATAL